MSSWTDDFIDLENLKNDMIGLCYSNLASTQPSNVENWPTNRELSLDSACHLHLFCRLCTIRVCIVYCVFKWLFAGCSILVAPSPVCVSLIHKQFLLEYFRCCMQFQRVFIFALLLQGEHPATFSFGRQCGNAVEWNIAFSIVFFDEATDTDSEDFSELDPSAREPAPKSLQLTSAREAYLGNVSILCEHVGRAASRYPRLRSRGCFKNMMKTSPKSSLWLMLNSLTDRFFIRRGWVVAVQLEKIHRLWVFEPHLDKI